MVPSTRSSLAPTPCAQAAQADRNQQHQSLQHEHDGAALRRGTAQHEQPEVLEDQRDE
jgi:hypothetical protein